MKCSYELVYGFEVLICQLLSCHLSFTVSKDDGFAHINRPRTLSGDASPISLSQTHLIGDALPAPGAMIRSNSDSSLMVDLEKTGNYGI